MISTLLLACCAIAAEPESKPEDNLSKSDTPQAKQRPAFEDDLYEGPAAKPASEPPTMAAKRWPVQILSAIYGTGGKDADVTAKVQDYVEKPRVTFSANPVALSADQ